MTASSPLCDAMVEVDEETVTSITPLAGLRAEPSATVFINGTLTGENGVPIYIGYHGKLEINNTTIIWH